jgi:hypothetical protein
MLLGNQILPSTFQTSLATDDPNAICGQNVGHQNCDATRQVAVRVTPFGLISVMYKLLTRILEFNEGEVIREGRKLHAEDVFVLYLSPNFFKFT